MLITTCLLIASSSQGGAVIPGYDVTSIADPTQVFHIAGGLLVLGGVDLGSAVAITDGLLSGSLSIAEVHHPTLVGAADGNTLSIGLDDNPSLEMIAERLFHEYGHLRDGAPSGPLNGGWLNSCGHYELYVATLRIACSISLEKCTTTCAHLDHLVDEMQRYYARCSQSGGSPVWPSSWPPSCCQ